MIPAGISGIEQQILLWMVAAIRPGAAFLVAPVFGAPGVPAQLRLIVAIAIGVPSVALAQFALPLDGMISVAGLLLILSETVLGLALGFAVQIGFASALLGGEAISNAMGLGFASMNDPMGGQSSPAIGQFLSMLATFLFLSMGGHLILAGLIVESFHALPPGHASLSVRAIGGLVQFGGLIFAAGVSVALPLGAAMILVQLVMAMIARSTPSLNLFAVGVPATLMIGIVLLSLATPVMGEALSAAMQAGLDQAERLVGAANG
jgi:flagellar biosynthesis protein FliR